MKYRWEKIRSAFTGKPVDSRQVAAMSLPKRFALPLFGSDGISSVAYAADEIILMLAVAGNAAIVYAPWVGLAVAVVGLMIVGTYRYNINQVAAEGDFELVHRRLGSKPAVILGASVLLDFVLTVAVSMSSAATFLVALYPELQDHRSAIAILLIIILTVVSLRGLQLMGKIAHWPLYIFLAILGVTLCIGIIKSWMGVLAKAESANYSVLPENVDSQLIGIAFFFLISRSFSAGAVALSGVSTISNSVRFFRRPKKHNAALTLMIMGTITGVLLVSILYIAQVTGVTMVHDTTQYLLIEGRAPGEFFHQKPALYQIALAIYDGAPLIPQLLVFATVAVLTIASFTAFIGFPLSSSALADRRYLPVQLRSINSVGLYRNGVLLLAVMATCLTLLFGSDIFSLIQLYLVGMFLSMLLTQGSVVSYRIRKLRITLAFTSRRHLIRDLAVSIIGVIVTAAVLITVIVTKFMAGAWLSLLIIATLFGGMMITRKHYDAVIKAAEIPCEDLETADLSSLPSRVHAIVYTKDLNKPVLRALAYARASHPSTLEALTVNNDQATLDDVKTRWDRMRIPVRLSVIDSPYRDTVQAVHNYVRRIQNNTSRDVIAVYIPEFVPEHWWQRLIHPRTVKQLKKVLEQEPNVILVTVPWSIHENATSIDTEDIDTSVHSHKNDTMYRGSTHTEET